MCPDRAPRSVFVLLTCEHGGRDVPAAYERLFRGAAPELASHLGSDIGALGVALRMASCLSAPLIFSTVTRLLIDLNRSLDQPDTFSGYTRDLPAPERDRVIAAYYAPHRDSVTRTVAAAISAGHQVLHVGVHSCTDVLRGQRRDLDIALLFDEARALERAFCERWREEIHRTARDLRCPFNEPYRGADDGLATTLRTVFESADYLGLEIEVRQGMILERAEQDSVGDLLAASLAAAAPELRPRRTA